MYGGDRGSHHEVFPQGCPHVCLFCLLSVHSRRAMTCRDMHGLGPCPTQCQGDRAGSRRPCGLCGLCGCHRSCARRFGFCRVYESESTGPESSESTGWGLADRRAGASRFTSMTVSDDGVSGLSSRTPQDRLTLRKTGPYCCADVRAESRPDTWGSRYERPCRDPRDARFRSSDQEYTRE